MITQKYLIDDWRIVILYLVEHKDFAVIQRHLSDIDCPSSFIQEGLDNLEMFRYNVGFTYSNIELHESVMVISKVTTEGELINTLCHECYHFITHITKLKEATEEEKATLMGNAMQLFFRQLQSILNII